MIVRLAGRIIEKHPDHLVLDVNGVGYHVWITVNTYETIPEQGAAITLLIHHQVREDSQELFGFAHAQERELFEHLIGISGIGAKTAITILSGALPDELRRRVQEEDEAALTAIKGVGPKMARRIITELRDAFGPQFPAGDLAGRDGAGPSRDIFSQAVQSLEALGYKHPEAYRAVRSAQKQVDDDAPIEELIRAALSGR